MSHGDHRSKVTHKRAPATMPAPPAIAAQGRLYAIDYGSFRNVCCDEENGAAVLRGCVPSWYLKQLAQEVVRRTAGVTTIVNELDVAGLRKPAPSVSDPNSNKSSIHEQVPLHGCQQFLSDSSTADRR